MSASRRVVLIVALSFVGGVVAQEKKGTWAEVRFNSDFRYPDYADRVVYTSREVEVLMLQFVAAKSPQFKLLAWSDKDDRRKEVIAETGKRFGGVRSFTIVKHTDVKVFTPTGPKDQSELEIQEEGSGTRLVLRKGVETALPVYFAQFALAENPDRTILRVKEGDHFDFPGGPASKTRLVSVVEDRARLSCEEKEFELVKGKAGAENLRVYEEPDPKGGETRYGAIFAEVPRNLKLDRSGTIAPFSIGIPANLKYQHEGYFDIIVEKFVAGPKCVAE